MIDQETEAATRTSARRWGTAAALVAAGLAGGVVLAGTVSANAADTTPTPSSTSSSSGATAGSGASTGSPTTPKNTDPSKPMRSDETLLTGDTASKVRAAALAKYPTATIQRVETDSDGVYEAHIVTADGQQLIVAVGKDFTVTGTSSMGAGGHGGPGGAPGGVDPDPNDNDGPGTNNPAGSGSSSTAPSASGTA